MEIVNIEARTFEAMLSAFRTFADRLDTLCRLYGDMEEKKMAGQPGGVPTAEGQPENPADLRDNGTLHIHRSAIRLITSPEDVESIIRIVEERRKRAESMGKSI